MIWHSLTGPEVPAVERIGVRLQEEKLTGKEGETLIPCRQGTVFGIAIERLGDGPAVDKNNSLRPADAVSAERNDALEQRHAGGQQAMGREQFFEGRRGSNDRGFASSSSLSDLADYTRRGVFWRN